MRIAPYIESASIFACVSLAIATLNGHAYGAASCEDCNTNQTEGAAPTFSRNWTGYPLPYSVWNCCFTESNSPEYWKGKIGATAALGIDRDSLLKEDKEPDPNNLEDCILDPDITPNPYFLHPVDANWSQPSWGWEGAAIDLAVSQTTTYTLKAEFTNGSDTRTGCDQEFTKDENDGKPYKVLFPIVVRARTPDPNCDAGPSDLPSPCTGSVSDDSIMLTSWGICTRSAENYVADYEFKWIAYQVPVQSSCGGPLTAGASVGVQASLSTGLSTELIPGVNGSLGLTLQVNASLSIQAGCSAAGSDFKSCAFPTATVYQLAQDVHETGDMHVECPGELGQPPTTYDLPLDHRETLYFHTFEERCCWSVASGPASPVTNGCN